jgi:hypothetical protein
MTSDSKDNALPEDLPLMKYLRNQTISNEVVIENMDKIYDVVVKHATRKEDVTEPLVSIYTFLFYYAKRAINPESGFNISRQNIIDVYTAYHKTLIKNIQEYDFKSSPPSTYDFPSSSSSSTSMTHDTVVNDNDDDASSLAS